MIVNHATPYKSVSISIRFNFRAIYDVTFERIWNTPNKYLPIIKKFKGVITPDFSVYRDMPLVMQQWNIYRSRAIGHWLQENGVSVIPDIRFGDERTYEASCAGIQKHGKNRSWLTRLYKVVIRP